jgi:hypothetical protein
VNVDRRRARYGGWKSKGGGGEEKVVLYLFFGIGDEVEEVGAAVAASAPFVGEGRRLGPRGCALSGGGAMMVLGFGGGGARGMGDGEVP